MKKVKIAVMNTSHEITEVLSELMRESGFDTCDMYTYKFKTGEVNFEEFIKENKPDVILYDIALPYKENYLLFKSLSSKEIVKNVPFILTTTNKNALQSLITVTSDVFEIVGKPYDLEELKNIVKKTVKQSS